MMHGSQIFGLKIVLFKLDRLVDVPRYVTRGSYQTVIDDKSGYDHILLTPESRQFVHNSLPFGWKTSPYIYHTTGLAVSSYFRSIKVPCSLYIDDRHNGELCVPLNEGAYVALSNVNDRYITAANSALFLVVSTWFSWDISFFIPICVGTTLHRSLSCFLLILLMKFFK